tara:strand:+ start:435 stop:992 length:558 start_codon:yes stop_codon:yes gene_type:complete
METKITQGIFIRLMEDSNESTKLSKIFSITGGNELYKKFEVIQLCKTKQKDNTGREIYKIVVTIEYAYDALNLIEKYCDNGRSNRYNQSYPRGPKHYINRHPERKEYEGVMDKKFPKGTLKIKNMDFYDIAVITNTHWITDAYNLFLRKSSNIKSADFQKYWFIPRPPDGSEQYEQEMGKPYDGN